MIGSPTIGAVVDRVRYRVWKTEDATAFSGEFCVILLDIGLRSIFGNRNSLLQWGQNS